MSLIPGNPNAKILRHDLEVLQGRWFWYLILGIVMVGLGTLALASPFLFTLTTATLISVMLLLGGVTEIIGAFWARNWSGYLVLVLIGILYAVVGLVTLGQPVEFAAQLTLVIAVFLMVGGVFRVASALATRHPHWIWMLLNGVVTLALGIMIWRKWPSTSLWVIGTFVGIDLILNGWTWVVLALAIKRLPLKSAETA